MIAPAAIILAAGASRRMGRPKLLLPWGGTTVLGHLAVQWRELGAAQVAVVCAAGDAALDAELEAIGLPHPQRIVNPDPARGMFSSIQAAARWEGWEPRCTHWTLVLGDQPHLRPATLRALLEFAGRAPGKICQPARGGRPRHPVIFPAAIFFQLRDARDESLAHFLRARPGDMALMESEDAGLDLDLDEPADYERARRL